MVLFKYSQLRNLEASRNPQFDMRTNLLSASPILLCQPPSITAHFQSSCFRPSL